ncbi:DNA repair protein RecO [Mailhella massiliensis]|uniref:DNA repair protein RecO n=1 Tax=Mailhella massiliensis TaxID=1903261 RepID=A0A921AV60_9BACT|nr:DNA repair protein RecO [Mailhella massiliensis]HJD96641.1 DNA repair protein RecO [Mailhella massiliensis]
MQWTDDALVLRIGKFREADLWVRLLAREKGLVTAFAFGGSRSRRRFTGCLDVYNRIRASAAYSRDGRFLNLQEATLLAGPERLRRDWRRQGMAANCVCFLEAMGVPPDNAQAGYALMHGMFQLLEEEAVLSPVMPVLFRFRLAAEQGYAPELKVCARCGRALSGVEQAHFLVGEGAVCCPSCRRPGDMSLFLGQEALDVLGKVKEYSPQSWGRLDPSPEGARQAARLIDAFVRYHLGLEWANGRFKAM